jgi:HK97 family phage major capsid protein
MELEKQLAELITEQKAFTGKVNEEIKSLGEVRTETKARYEALQTQVDAIDKKIAEKHAGAAEAPSLIDVLKEEKSFQDIVQRGSGRASVVLKGAQVAQMFERKTTITSSAVGAQTTGVLQIDRIPGITAEARQQLTVRDLLSARPTAMQVIDFVKVNAAPKIASPQVEASDKAENAVTFTSASEKVRTIATWIPATKQILADFQELAGYLNSALPYYVNLEEELQLLSGDGTGENLDGLITQSSDFGSVGLVAGKGWTKLDVIGRAIQQITVAKEIPPTFVVLNPNDWWDIRLTKDQYGRYILGDPQMPVANPQIFGLSLVSTTSIASGSFLVGSGNSVAAEIRDRMEMQVEISTEHSDYFVKNMVAVRAEKRLALIVKRAASFVNGTFTTSP